MSRTRHAVVGVLVTLAALATLVGVAPAAPAGAADPAPVVPEMSVRRDYPDVPSTVTPMRYWVDLFIDARVSFSRVEGLVQVYVDGVPVGDPDPVVAYGYKTNGVAAVETGPMEHGLRTVTFKFTPAHPEETAPAEVTTQIDVAWGSVITLESHPDVQRFEPTTITARISAGDSSGTVEFALDGASMGAPVPVVDGFASLTTADIGVGPADITATFSGNATYLGSSTGEQRLFYVRPASTVTTTTTSTPQPVVGQGVVIEAEVAPEVPRTGQPAVGGTADLLVSGFNGPVSNAPVVAGKVTFPPVEGLPVGLRSFTVSFRGEGDYARSSQTLDLSIGAALVPTTTALALSPAAPKAGDDVTVTAQVTPAAAGGTVTFTGPGGPVTSPVVAGAAVLSLDDVAAGPLVLGAAYSGDATHAASTSEPLTVAVAKHSVSVTVVPTGPAAVGSDVPLEVTVASTTSGAAPTGTVTVVAGGETFTGLVLTGGKATTPPIRGWVAGPNDVSSTYSGDDRHQEGSAATQVTALTVVEAAVAEGYASVLGRPADAAGAAHWAAQLSGGRDLEQVLDQIARSAEGRSRLVDLAFGRTLGRTPSAADRAYWAGRLQAGLTGEDLLAALLATDEGYRRAGATPAGFAARLATVHLGRTLTGSELAYWKAQATAATTPGARRVLALKVGRTAEATTVAVRRALTEACGVPGTTPSIATALGDRWASQGRHPLRLVAAAQALACPPAAA